MRRFLLFVMSIVFVFFTGLASAEKVAISPVNPHFKEFLEKGYYKTFTKDGYPLGLVPSPIPPKTHKEMPSVLQLYLPSRYDLREYGLLTPVKNQGSYGTCWAFATYGSLESDLLKLGFPEFDFSENHLASNHGFDLGFDDGGNIYMSSAYLARGDGPVAESCDPYPSFSGSFNQASCPRLRYIEQIRILPGRSSVVDNAYLKEAVYEHGAVYSSIYWDSSCWDAGTNTYYCPQGVGRTNHAVVIVGWDDNKVVPGAPAPGAFIVRNSWGSSWGDNGYFYVSYYDEDFASKENAYFIDEPDINGGSFSIYQYDEFGMLTGIKCSGGIWGANVFQAREDLYLEAISFFIRDPADYEISVYLNCQDPSSATTSSVTISGRAYTEGFYTRRLNSPLFIPAASSFCVFIHLTNYADDAYPLALESKIDGFSSGVTIASNQSFYSCSGTYWYDVADSGGNLGNVCIKAIVRNRKGYRLSVSVNGSGKVTSSPSGISCPGDCSESFAENTRVTLTAVPSSGYRFSTWGGDCSSCKANSNCSVVLSSDKTCTAKFVEEEQIFDDVSATGEWSWAYEYINELYNEGITSGCSTNPLLYCPGSLVTREQMAVFILKAMNIAPASTCTGRVFSDVNTQTVEEIFCRYIEKFAQLGITAGCELDDPSTPENEAKFCPKSYIDRAQMAVFITKALGYQPASVCTGNVFYDVNAGIGEGFCRYIERFKELNITSGCWISPPLYCPFEYVNRAQMAVFIIRGFFE